MKNRFYALVMLAAEDGAVVISAEELASVAPAFKNWKAF